MRRNSVQTVIAAMLFATTNISMLSGEEKRIEPDRIWTGEFGALLNPGSARPVIASEAAWRTQWKDLQRQGDVPKIDFARRIVVIQSTDSSQLVLKITLDDQGDLKVLGTQSLDLVIARRKYVAAVVPRAGVKSVNGQPLPRE